MKYLGKQQNISDFHESGFQTDGIQKEICRKGLRNTHKIVDSVTK